MVLNRAVGTRATGGLDNLPHHLDWVVQSGERCIVKSKLSESVSVSRTKGSRCCCGATGSPRRSPY
jgi:hypothetical protein